MQWEKKADKDIKKLQEEVLKVEFIKHFYIFLREELTNMGLKKVDVDKIVAQVKRYVRYQSETTKN